MIPILTVRQAVLPHETESLPAAVGDLVLLRVRTRRLGTLARFLGEGVDRRTGPYVLYEGVARVRIGRAGYRRLDLAAGDVEPLRLAIARHLRRLVLPRERRPWRDLLRVEDAAEFLDRAASEVLSRVGGRRARGRIHETLDADQRLQLLVRLARRLPGAEPVPRWGETVIWRRHLRGARHAVLPSKTGLSNPVVAGDLLVASVCSPGRIVCCDRASGRVRWSRSFPRFSADVQVHGLQVLAMAGNGLQVLDLGSGRSSWSFTPVPELPEGVYSTPVVADGRVFLGDRRGRLHALALATGAPLWRHELGRRNQINMRPLVLGDRVFAATVNPDPFAFACDAATGRLLWRVPLEGPCGSRIQAFQGSLLLQAGASLLLLDPADGSLRLRLHWEGWETWSWCVAGDTVVVALLAAGGMRPGRLLGLRAGAVVFEHPTEFLSSLVSSALVYGSDSSGLHVWDPGSGTRLASLPCDPRLDRPGNVAVADGVLYALSSEGYLWALRHP